MTNEQLHEGSPTFEIQEAVHRVLKEDTVLQTMCPSGIFDGRVPAGTVMPYLVIKDWIETSDDILTRLGFMDTFQIHIWSSYEGFREAKLIGSRISKLLNRVRLGTTVWHTWNITFDGLRTVDEMDNIRHIIVRFKVRTDQRL